MIFNEEKVVEFLYRVRYLCGRDLTNKDIQILETLTAYFIKKEPKITFDEFLELFDVETKAINTDTVELVVVPKNKFYAKVRGDRLYTDKMNVSAEIQEHLQTIAYGEFKKVLDNLGGQK